MGLLPQNVTFKGGGDLSQEMFSEFVEICDELRLQLGIKAETPRIKRLQNAVTPQYAVKCNAFSLSPVHPFRIERLDPWESEPVVK